MTVSFEAPQTQVKQTIRQEMTKKAQLLPVNFIVKDEGRSEVRIYKHNPRKGRGTKVDYPPDRPTADCQLNFNQEQGPRI